MWANPFQEPAHPTCEVVPCPLVACMIVVLSDAEWVCLGTGLGSQAPGQFVANNIAVAEHVTSFFQVCNLATVRGWVRFGTLLSCR